MNELLVLVIRKEQRREILSPALSSVCTEFPNYLPGINAENQLRTNSGTALL